jgi:hypothetical protein
MPKKTDKFFEPNDVRKPKWKKGDKVICINNSADQIQVMDDYDTVDAFSSRFTTIKLDRKEKLNKLKNV